MWSDDEDLARVKELEMEIEISDSHWELGPK